MNPSACLGEENNCWLFSVFTVWHFYLLQSIAYSSCCLSVVVGAYLAKLMANNGSWTSSISRCCAMMDCIFMRLLLVVCCSVTVSVGDESWLQRRDCTDSRNNVYKLFLSASERQHFNSDKYTNTALKPEVHIKSPQHSPLEDLSDCSSFLQSRFLSSCMDFPAMMICLRTGLRKDTMVSCLLLEPWSPPELPLAASFSFSSVSTVSDTLYNV